MKKNEQITALSEEIMIDITNERIALHNAMLKTARLSLLLDMPVNVTYFKDHAKIAEQLCAKAASFKDNIEATKDANMSVASANPNQTVFNPSGNFYERKTLRDEHSTATSRIAFYRAETFNFALGIHTKWLFGDVAESIFENKRKRTEPVLREMFPDAQQRLNSIEQNIQSSNPEDWKNATVSCRTLLMDLADLLNPATQPDDKPRYINRLKDYVSPKIESKTQTNILCSMLEETKKRIEYTIDATQGGAHKDRPTLIEAQNCILYTYLIVSDLLEIYSVRDLAQLQSH